MTTERLLMRHIREVLRQKWVLDLSHRAVAASLGISVGVIAATLGRARAAGLEWRPSKASSTRRCRRGSTGDRGA